MVSIDLTTISLILGIFSTLSIGAIWVLVMVSKVSSRLTLEQTRITKLDIDYKDLLKKFDLEKDLNTKFRHSYAKTADSLISSLEHLQTVFDLKLNNIDIKLDYISKKIKD